MLIGSVAEKTVSKTTSMQDGAALLWAHPQVCSELLELLDVLEARLEHLHRPVTTHRDVPLQVHARYSRVEILGAFGIGDTAKVAPWQTGVYWASDAHADLLAFTLDKAQLINKDIKCGARVWGDAV
jgi:hypothetical protein